MNSTNEDGYSKEQMLQIALGECDELDVSVYKRPDYTSYRMCLIRVALKNGISTDEYTSEQFTCDDATKFMREMKILQGKVNNIRYKKEEHSIWKSFKKVKNDTLLKIVGILLQIGSVEVLLAVLKVPYAAEMTKVCQVMSALVGIVGLGIAWRIYKVQKTAD